MSAAAVASLLVAVGRVLVAFVPEAASLVTEVESLIEGKHPGTIARVEDVLPASLADLPKS